MMSVLLTAAVLAGVSTSIAAAQSRPAVTFIDLAKAPLHREGDRWLGKRLADVLPSSSVARLLLLAAVTSATADLDAANIMRLLSQDVRFEHPPQGWDSALVIWEAVIESRDGRVFRLRATNAWVQLVAPDAHGFFKVLSAQSPA